MSDKSPVPDAASIVETAKVAELALIAAEQKAAARLGAAQHKLEKDLRALRKAQMKVDERMKEVVQAETALSNARESRLGGFPSETPPEISATRERGEPPERD